MSNKPIKILLIEDNPGDSRLIQEMLAEETAVPYDFKYVERLSTGLEIISREGSDLILLDLGLPDSQGLETLKIIQTQFPGKPTVVLTGLDNKDIALAAMQEGAQDYLIKGKVSSSEVLWRIIRYAIERKRAEEKSRQSEEKYRTLFEQSRDPIFITKRSGEFVDVNQAMLDLFGYTRKEMMDINVRETYVNPVDRSQFQKAIESKGFVQDHELKFRKKEGTEIECLATSTLRRDDNGNILGYQGILHDMTESNLVKKELEKSYTRLQKAIKATIKAIALTSEIRDPYTAGHQQRVAELACAIAKEMGLNKEQIETINVAGILHDIGKLYVPAEILSKPSKLNEIEMNMIRTHAQLGSDILEALELPWAISPIVLQHHERMDGSGYPAGISNGDIPIEARILAVADVVEAMMSHRPYRPALGIDQALEEIHQNKGKLYDPDVVDACLALFKEKGFELKEPSRINVASSLI